MKKTLLIGTAFIILALAVLGFAGFAFAQSQTPPPPEYPYGQGMMGGAGMMGGGSMMGGAGMMGGGSMMGGSGYGMMGSQGPMHEYMINALAEGLGLTADEVQARLDAGDSLWTIAQAQGLSQEEFTNLMLEARAKALQQAVDDGVVTQAQADWMNQHMQQMPGNGFGTGGCPMHGGGFGSGRGRGMRGNNP